MIGSQVSKDLLRTHIPNSASISRVKSEKCGSNSAREQSNHQIVKSESWSVMVISTICNVQGKHGNKFIHYSTSWSETNLCIKINSQDYEICWAPKFVANGHEAAWSMKPATDRTQISKSKTSIDDWWCVSQCSIHTPDVQQRYQNCYSSGCCRLQRSERFVTIANHALSMDASRPLTEQHYMSHWIIWTPPCSSAIRSFVFK